MGVKKETSLQTRIQDFLEKKRAYVFKNWGNMTTEPGRADLTVCYKGIYIAIEVKEDENYPTPAQGIHARKVWKAGGICLVAWSIAQVDTLLSLVDYFLDWPIDNTHAKNISNIHTEMKNKNLDDGTRY